MPDTSDGILGCILGGAIGDAAGSSVEGLPCSAATMSWREAEWRLTDDTQLTLATCEAITHDEPHPSLVAAALLRWYRARRLTGLGASTLKALRDLDAGAPWTVSGRTGERAAGNGAAMRIAPLAFCTDPHTRDGRRLIRDVCRITHQDDEAYVGALAVVLAIRKAMESGHPPPLETIIADLPDSSVRDRLELVAALPPGTTPCEAAIRYGTSGHVVDSVPFALFATRWAARLGFTGMLDRVVGAGGDTDTNASLACQVVGAALGLRSLPTDLLERLPDHDEVLLIARTFAHRFPSPK